MGRSRRLRSDSGPPPLPRRLRGSGDLTVRASMTAARTIATHVAATAQRATRSPGGLAILRAELDTRRRHPAAQRRGDSRRQQEREHRDRQQGGAHVGERPLAEILAPQLQIERADLVLERFVGRMLVERVGQRLVRRRIERILPQPLEVIVEQAARRRRWQRRPPRPRFAWQADRRRCSCRLRSLSSIVLVPTLRVGSRVFDALRLSRRTRSLTRQCVPAQSVGTRENSLSPAICAGRARRGNTRNSGRRRRMWPDRVDNRPAGGEARDKSA